MANWDGLKKALLKTYIVILYIAAITGPWLLLAALVLLVLKFLK
jgi:hypothetical protein